MQCPSHSAVETSKEIVPAGGNLEGGQGAPAAPLALLLFYMQDETPSVQSHLPVTGLACSALV